MLNKGDWLPMEHLHHEGELGRLLHHWIMSYDQLNRSSIEWMLIPHNPGRPALNHPGQAWHLILARPATWIWSVLNHHGQACHLDQASPEPHWPGLLALEAWPVQPPRPGQARTTLARPGRPPAPGQAQTTLARPVGLARPATWTCPGPNHTCQACQPGQAGHLDLVRPGPNHHGQGGSAWPGWFGLLT